jgi:heat shock protein HslJ
MKNIHFLILFVLVFILSSCELLGSKSKNGHPKDLPLIGTAWWLQTFQNERGKRSESTMDDIKLVFTTPDSLQGKAHHKSTAGDLLTSNRYFGTFTVENSSLQVKEIYTTEVGTPSGSRYDEYLAALKEALTYKIEKDRLIIFYQ